MSRVRGGVKGAKCAESESRFDLLQQSTDG